MRKIPRLITDNETLRAEYNTLGAGDCVVGRVRLKASEEHIFIDLLERGVRFFPSALAQLASRSKVLQARLFPSYMMPHTRAVHDIHQLHGAMAVYHGSGIDRVVTKQDRANAGLGVHLWHSVEDVYNQASLGVLPFPFVLQPFVGGCRDIRVIVLGDYVESYRRENSNNFRNNLHFGGRSTPCDLSEEQREMCRAVMARGKFPYGHVDLMVLPDGQTFLSEINLRGGLRGARINSPEYVERLAEIHRQAEKDMAGRAS